MDLTTVDVEIKGITPLMQDRFPNPKESLPSAGKRSKKADNRTAWEKVLDRVHFTEDGTVYLPAEALEKCIHSGAKRIIMKGRTTWLNTFKSGLIVEPDQPAIFNDVPITRGNIESHMVIDGRKAINHNMGTGTAVWTERAKFKEWGIRFLIKILNPAIELSVLEDSLSLAGLYDGLGAFRSNPRFGRFELISFKRSENGN